MEAKKKAGRLSIRPAEIIIPKTILMRNASQFVGPESGQELQRYVIIQTNTQKQILNFFLRFDK